MKKVISIFSSMLLLASSSGIAYAQHFCGEYEMLAEITLGEKHLSCGMMMEVTSCEDNMVEDHHCCENEYLQVNTDDNFAKASFSIDFHQPFIVAFVSVFVFQEFIDDTITPDFLGVYHPPPLYEDIPVLYETFLI